MRKTQDKQQPKTPQLPYRQRSRACPPTPQLPIADHEGKAIADAMTTMPLAQYFGLNRRYARSINLTRDLDKRDAVQGYVPTERSLDALRRILPALIEDSEPSHRAWTMTGVYGTGKSAFAHYLLALCAPESSTVRQEAVAIAQSSFPDNADDHQLIGAVPDKGLIRAAAAGQREPLAHTIARALVTGANSFWRRKKNKSEDLFRQITDWEVELDSINPTISDQSILRVIKELVTQAKTSLILVIDELGKNLEFAAHHQGINDLYLLQQIAEMELEDAHQVYFLGILHQSFSGYSERLTATEQSEWNKIQGRFEDIVFTESPSQMTRLIGQVIVSPESPVVDSIHQMANQWFAALQPVLSEHEVSASVLAAAYPLHPVTALVLPLLCVRYAQSDRSLFTFLTSDEPFGLKAFLDKTTVIESAVGDKMPTLQLHQVYDYFVESANGMASRGNVQRWVEIQGLVEDARDLSPGVLKLFKTIGVLNLITATGRLRATPELVTLALCSQPDQDEEKAHWQSIIDDLLKRGLLTHRRQLDELRLWQGSDFNVELAIRQQVEQDYDPLAAVLTVSHPLSPVVAQRHYTTTGTLRYFEQRYGDSRLDLAQVKCSDRSFDGLVVIWLDSQLPDAWVAERGQTMPTTTADGKPLVVVATTQLDLLRVRAREFRALGQVLRQAPELRTDKVAAKEIKHRLAEAEQLLDETLAQVLAPSAEGCRYWIAGESQAIGSDRQFQSTLSALCDRAYHRSLILDNELINRRELTSQGAKARRELLEAMLEQSDQERLGFTGYGPEVAMYYSVLEASGIHRLEADHWGFYPPSVAQTQTGPVDLTTAWEAIESFCFKSTEKQRSLQLLYDELSQPPYGIKAGVVPVLLAAVLLHHTDDVGIYKDGTFIPVLGPEHFELLVKDPARFSVKYFEIVGLRSQVFRELESILRSPNTKTPEGIRNASLLLVARPLFSFVRKLPKYTLHTSRISAEAQAVLKTLQTAQEPDELLFISLPVACGFEPMGTGVLEDDSVATAFRKKLVQCLHEIQTAYDCLLTDCQTRLHEAFEVKSSQEKLREDLGVRSRYLKDQCLEPVLRRFVIAAADETTSDREWLEALMMIVVDKPPKSWRDEDLLRLEIALSDVVRRFRNLEALQKEVVAHGQGFEAVRITQTESDGYEINEVVSIDASRKESLEKIAERILQDYTACENSGMQKELVAILNRKVFELGRGEGTDELAQKRQRHQTQSPTRAN